MQLNTVCVSVKDRMKTVITSEYEALFRQHFRLATLYAERIVGSAHEAEDIVQEVFIALLDADFSQIRQKESYLYRCVRNAALDRLHARMKNRFYDINSKETVRLAAEESALGDEQVLVEQIAVIYRRIEALPEQGRRIFKMICIEHKSYVETARLLSLSLHTVKTPCRVRSKPCARCRCSSSRFFRSRPAGIRTPNPILIRTDFAPPHRKDEIRSPLLHYNS